MAYLPFNSTTGRFNTQTTGITVGDGSFSQTTTQLLRIADVDPQFNMLNDGSSLFYRMMAMLATEEAATQPRYEFFADDKYATRTTVNYQAGYDAAATSIKVDDAIGVVNGVLYNVRTGEAMYITAVSDTDLTVVRGHQGTTAAAIVDGDTLLALGAFLPEGADANGGIFQLPTMDWNYVSFYSQGVSATDVQDLTAMLNGAGQSAGEFRKQTQNLMEQMDNDLRWSTRSYAAVSNGRVYHTNGFNSWVTTNRIDLEGALDWYDFNENFNPMFEPTSSSPTKILLCGQGLFSAINKVCWDRWTANPAFESTLGATMGTIALDGGGMLNIVLDKYGFASGTPLTNKGFVIDMNTVKLKPYTGFDLSWREVTQPQSHTRRWEVFGSSSLKMIHEENNAVVEYTA